MESKEQASAKFWSTYAGILLADLVYDFFTKPEFAAIVNEWFRHYAPDGFAWESEDNEFLKLLGIGPLDLRVTEPRQA